MFRSILRVLQGFALAGSLTAAGVMSTAGVASAAPKSLYTGPIVDNLASNDPQSTCDPTPKPGVVEFRDMVLATYPSTEDFGISRDCGIGGTSEHKEGRAWDWKAYVTDPADNASVNDMLNWLLATDRYGNQFANARRFGIQYIIWNNQWWRSYSTNPVWQPYGGENPHTDHVHFTFSWDGANKQTSWWQRITAHQGMDALSNASGYWLAQNNGTVVRKGGAPDLPFPSSLNQPLIGMSAPRDDGYWLAAADGGLFSYGSAPFLGSLGGVTLNAGVVGIAGRSTNNGYWMAGADGGLFAFGDAPYLGNVSGPLNAPIVGIAGHPNGNGYWMVGADGGVFALGSSGFYGSLAGGALNKPIVGIAPTVSGNGYWLVAADGGVFAFGDAPFRGSLGATPPAVPVTGVHRADATNDYWLVVADGSVHAYGDVRFFQAGTGTAANAAPIGNTDESTVTRVRGWAYDPNEPSRSINIHVYIDGVGYDLGPTSTYRGDVNSAYNVTGNHGFDWQPPAQWSDGNTHTIEVYAIDSTGGPNPRLSVTTSSGINYPPEGEINWFGAHSVAGWARDPNQPFDPINIEIKIDTTAYVIPTTLSHPAAPNGNHGFDWPVPPQWRDGRLHTMEVRALDSTSGPSTLLGSTRFRVLADDWTQATNSLWNSAKWITTSNSASRWVNVENNQGRLYVNGSSARATATMAAVPNSDVIFTYRFSNANPKSYLRVMLRASGASGDEQMTNGYRVELRSDSNTIKLQRYINGTSSQIDSFSYTSGASAHHLRFEVRGATMQVKAWPAGDVEPLLSQIDRSDTGVTGSGVFQINHNWSSDSISPRSVDVDDLILTDLNP